MASGSSRPRRSTLDWGDGCDAARTPPAGTAAWRTGPTPTCSGTGDARERRDRPRPTSKPYSVTVGGSDDRVTITIPALRLTCGGSTGARSCASARARSLAGDTSAYYRITSLDPSTAGGGKRLRGQRSRRRHGDRDRRVQRRDAGHAGRTTTGGVPSGRSRRRASSPRKGRVFWADANDPSGVYSQERADRYAIEATPELRLQVPPAGGAVHRHRGHG